jgi:hypothetical protein
LTKREQQQEKSKALDAAIVVDIQNPDLGYLEIAIRHHVAVNRIATLATKHGLNRKRGKKPTKPQLTEAQKQAARMAKGRCAVHGHGLQAFTYLPCDTDNPTGLWCPRNDCKRLYIQAGNDRLAVVPYEGN